MRDRSKLAAAALALFAFLVAWALLDVPTLPQLRQWANDTGAWFPVIFWLLYVLITQFPIPRTIMTISAGILFGTVQGIFIALTATTVSAVISLTIVRFLLRDWIASKLTHPAIEGINARLAERGWLAILSLRMIGAVPFSILNYAAALTRVRVLPFAAATLVGSIPGTVLVTIFGDTLTGEADPTYIAIMGVLALLGLAGLLIDVRLPTRQGSTVDKR